MSKNSFEKSLKFVPKLWATLLYFLGMVFAFYLFYGRKSEAVRFKFLTDNWPEFYQNISNFSLSYILYTGIGFIWLMMAVKFKYVVGLGLFLIASNLIYEFFIPVLNTPDAVDAWFGVAGSVLGFFVLLIIEKFGLKLNPEWNKN